MPETVHAVNLFLLVFACARQPLPATVEASVGGIEPGLPVQWDSQGRARMDLMLHDGTGRQVPVELSGQPVVLGRDGCVANILGAPHLAVSVRCIRSVGADDSACVDARVHLAPQVVEFPEPRGPASVSPAESSIRERLMSHLADSLELVEAIQGRLDERRSGAGCCPACCDEDSLRLAETLVQQRLRKLQQDFWRQHQGPGCSDPLPEPGRRELLEPSEH